jgi:hypothetical protein
MANADIPQSLVVEGRLVLHNIYRTAKLNEGRTALVKAKISDQFPDIIPNDPWDGTGVLSTCLKQLCDGDEVHGDQWKSLQVWHAGLSCQLFLKPKILFDVENTNCLNDFNDPTRKQNMQNETGSYRIFQVFELKKGSSIPKDIGIELDGDNHVSLYPTGDNAPISDIEHGLASFTIDAFVTMEDMWTPFALLQVRASGFSWPEEFPPDTDVFPFRQWVSFVINCAESDISIDTSNHIENYLSGHLVIQDFLSKMVDICNRYAYDCSFDHIAMNCCVLKSLRFALNINMLV